MAKLAMYREPTGKITVKLQGTFDGPAALQLKQLLEEMGQGEVVVVDFSHVRDFLDLAVGVLTRAVSEHKVQLRGLRSHQERVLKYFGLPATEAAQPSYSPEEALGV